MSKDPRLDTFFAILEKHWAWEEQSGHHHADVHGDLNNDEEADDDDLPIVLDDDYVDSSGVLAPDLADTNDGSGNCADGAGSSGGGGSSLAPTVLEGDSLGCQTENDAGQGHPSNPDLKHEQETLGTDTLQPLQKVPLPPLPSDLFGDASKPLTADQRAMIKQRVDALKSLVLCLGFS